MKAYVYVMICMIGIGILWVMAFPLKWQTAGVCQVTGWSLLRAHTSCDAKSLHGSLCHCSSFDVVDLEKAHLKGCLQDRILTCALQC